MGHARYPIKQSIEQLGTETIQRVTSSPTNNVNPVRRHRTSIGGFSISGNTLISSHNLIHKAASKMTGKNVKEFYFRQRQWKAQLNHPRMSDALYK